MTVNTNSEVKKWCESTEFSGNFERWMGELPDCLKSVPITHLAIPGTHDSMSCGISKTSGISPDSAAFVKILGKFLGPLVKPIVLKWCVTQRRAMEEQLIAGIRYFDLRIAVHKPSGQLQFVHGMYAQEITQPFLDIKSFLLGHEQEVVVLDVQHFYDFTCEDHKKFQSFLHDHFGKMMCPLFEEKQISKVTLRWMTEQRYQVILIYRHPMGHGDSQLWPSQYWPTPWPETTSVKNMISFLQNGLSHRPSNAGYVTQCVLTPNTWFVIRHPLSNLLNKCAAPCNYSIITWLEQQQPGETGINVVITDYFDFDPAKFPFVKTVVLLNRKHEPNH